MIKRVLAFLLLILAGFAILWATVGDDSIARIGKGGNQIKVSDEPETPSGVMVKLGEEESLTNEVSVSIKGGLSLKERRQVERADGSVASVLLYQLECRDSRRVRDGRQELIDTTVTFYEEGGTPDQPIAVEAGRLLAKSAFVELGLDDEGRQSVDQDKDIDLLDAVLLTGPDARVKNLRLELSHAKVQSTEDGIRIRTARDDDDVRVELIDERGPAVLTGKGMRASLPTRAEGVATSELPMSVTVLSDPSLTHTGTDGVSTLRARGPLVYHEEPDTGIARIEVTDDVVLDSQFGIGGESGTWRATGNRMFATLRRGKSAAAQKTQMQWSRMHLVGTPDRLAQLRGDDLLLTCQVVDITPNVAGDPWLFTANGNPALDYTVDGRVMKFRAEHKIRLVRVDTHLAPWIEGRGWHRPNVAPMPSQLMVFEGASELTLPREDGELVLDASEGLLVLRGETDTDPMRVLGRGTVDLGSRDAGSELAVKGNLGFLLRVDHEGQHLRLGPERPTSRHEFEVATSDMRILGTGSCSLFRPTDETVPGSIALVSPREDLDLTLPDSAGSLRQVANLTARFDATGIRTFDARGQTTLFSWKNDEDAVEGRATRIWSTAAGAYQLSGAPAVLDSDRGGEFRGDVIHVTQLTEQDVMLVAEGHAQLITEGAQRDGAEPLFLDLTARRIAYLPFLAPRAVGSWPVAVLPSGVGSMNSPHLLARDEVFLRHLDAEGELLSEARGDLLALDLTDQPTGRILGAPATVRRRDSAGQTLVGQAPEILMGGAGETIDLRPGEGQVVVTLGDRQGAMANFGQADGTTRMTCRGAVTADGDGIGFGDWVEVRSFLANGEEDTEGFHMDSQRLRMRRDAETGEVVEILATQGSKLRWRGAQAVSEELTVNLLTSMCTVVDKLSAASVRLPNGFEGRCKRAVFNYLTYEAKIWQIQVAADRTSK